MFILVLGDESHELSDTIASMLGYGHLCVESKTDPSTGLLSDDLAIEDIIAAVECTESDIVLSGYPGNVIQAQSLDYALAECGQIISAAVILDDTSGQICKLAKDLRRYYRTQNKHVLIDATDTVADICEKIFQLYQIRRPPVLPAQRGK